MTFACLGWGSLVWDPGDLPVAEKWEIDGPALPVEFCRKSNNGRITLVIWEEVQPVPVLWTRLDVKSLDEAREALRKREGIPVKNLQRSIGWWSPDAASGHSCSRVIGEWAAALELNGVVWTALGPKFGDSTKAPSGDEIVDYLLGLDGDKRRLAEEYIRLAPSQITTPYRSLIERKLGWGPREASINDD